MGKEKEVPYVLTLIPQPLPPFPWKLKKKFDEKKYQKFTSMSKKLLVNITLVEALDQMLGYGNFMKDWLRRW